MTQSKLRFLGTIIVVLLPVLLAIWFAHIRAVLKPEISYIHLRSWY